MTSRGLASSSDDDDEDEDDDGFCTTDFFFLVTWICSGAASFFSTVGEVDLDLDDDDIDLDVDLDLAPSFNISAAFWRYLSMIDGVLAGFSSSGQ